MNRRATVYFHAPIHRALRLRAVAMDKTISEIVNEAVQLVLTEDAEDMEAFDERAGEKSVDFTAFVKRLRRSGRI